VKLVQSCIDSGNAIAPAKVKWTAAVQAYRVLNKQVAPILRALRAYLINTYGPTSTVLADFGFSPHQDGGEDARSEGPGCQEVRGHPQGPEHAWQEAEKNITGATVTPVAPATSSTASAPAAPTAPATPHS
jgi:hypothetical protein